MILVINQTLKIMNADDNFGGYKSRMNQFLLITFLSFIVTFSFLIPFINKMDINILSTFYLFLNDYLNCALYPLFEITYCYNKNITIMIKNIIFCKNN